MATKSVDVRERAPRSGPRVRTVSVPGNGNGDSKRSPAGKAARSPRDAAPVSGRFREIPADLGFDKRGLLKALLALKKGDFSVRLPLEWGGIDGKIAETFNSVAEMNERVVKELERLARVVVREGRISERASLAETTGAWERSIQSVNELVGNLVHPVAETARVIGAVAKGDLSQTMALNIDDRPLAGEFLRTAKTVNTMVEQLGLFASEVTRVAREVGTEGMLGGQAKVRGVAGTWKDLTDSVNLMASNLTSQVRNIAAVTTAVATGDLTKKITVDAKGEIRELKNTINTMVDQLNSFASEVTRVAREVGTDGKLGGQAEVKGVAGTWKDLTDKVNLMASNLTGQVRNIAAVTTAVASGDLTKKITVDAKGEIMELKNTVNTMVDQLNSFASEVTRVAREVGTDGKLGGQADVRGVGGTWKDLTDSVNSMAGNLTNQVRGIAAVTTAVASGDLAKKITVDAKGEILELKNTMNTMVDQLSSFAAEVTRVAREVGTDGKLGGQSEVKGVAGIWKDLTDNVNLMASNLTNQVRNIAAVTTAVASGDLTKKITVDAKGEIMELKNTINTMVDQLSSFAAEVTRVAREVGTDGKLGGQADVRGVGGTWKDLTDNVNLMASNLTNQVRNIAAVTTAVATGDLTKKITVDAKGEILELKSTVNTMVDQLNSFASEVTRVAREVGTDGKLGGQADVRGVGGTWKDLTDNVNSMAGNLTNQVRGIAKVMTAVANGNLNRKLTVDAKGEIAALADTINGMIETLATFAEQVTTVAREVGVEGKLGGQANVPGAAGTWKDLTDNVNQLAANLTTQVRAIAEVATAVTKGDLTRTIAVAAQGEVAALKDNINEMIRNLRETTQKNSDQDWLKTNLAKFSRMLQGQKDLLTVGKLILSELAPVVSAQHGVFYVMDNAAPDEPLLKLLASYAYKERKHIENRFKLGEGLVGQCALEKSKILLTNVPGDYIKITSGLGEASPMNIMVLPVLFEGQVKAVVELASFDRFSPTHETFLDQLAESIGIVLNTIEANMRTENLLKQSQSLARELQSQQQELQTTNAQLEEKAKQLADQNVEVERKNKEVEQARQALEEKAKQLALTSKYKSEFLANMSHELRTPLNSLLILSDQLANNGEGNLLPRQVQFARTIHSAGNDLLALINDILDLSKIESGTVIVDIGDVTFLELQDYVERTFRHIAESKGLEFALEWAPNLPHTVHTDAKRLQQILKNLLSNAFKFTEQGCVTLHVHRATEGWSADRESLSAARTVLAFSVSDTGIGIPADKQAIIFEAFQQADGSTSRKYGGTGLGLAISRELAQLLGGELKLVSKPGEGSTFTLYLPQAFQPARQPRRASGTESVLVVNDPPGTLASTIPPAAAFLQDDNANIQPGDRVLLIVENDGSFAPYLLDAAHQHGFKGIVVGRGVSALGLAKELKPHAITLDINLPDLDGWRVLERLKHDPETGHIPVQIITTDDDVGRGLRSGAMGALRKPIQTSADLDHCLGAIRRFIERDQRRMLLVIPDEARRRELSAMCGGDGVEIRAEGGDADVLALLGEQEWDVLVLDIELPAMRGLALVQQIRAEERFGRLPILVYSSGTLSRRDETQLKRLVQTSVVRDIRSPERLLDETTIFLHRRVESLPEEKRQILRTLREANTLLAGKRVLVVDDDVRNIFAMTSILEPHQMQVFSAETGRAAIEILQATPEIDVVLMDIMMPNMDGYETMEAIRRMPRFRALPIIALTAKAMKGDREKCIEAGASDYIAKPVDPLELLSMLRVWLRR